jgi:hypothetical protein
MNAVGANKNITLFDRTVVQMGDDAILLLFDRHDFLAQGDATGGQPLS